MKLNAKQAEVLEYLESEGCTNIPPKGMTAFVFQKICKQLHEYNLVYISLSSGDVLEATQITDEGIAELEIYKQEERDNNMELTELDVKILLYLVDFGLTNHNQNETVNPLAFSKDLKYRTEDELFESCKRLHGYGLIKMFYDPQTKNKARWQSITDKGKLIIRDKLALKTSAKESVVNYFTSYFRQGAALEALKWVTDEHGLCIYFSKKNELQKPTWLKYGSGQKYDDHYSERASYIRVQTSIFKDHIQDGIIDKIIMEMDSELSPLSVEGRKRYIEQFLGKFCEFAGYFYTAPFTKGELQKLYQERSVKLKELVEYEPFGNYELRWTVEECLSYYYHNLMNLTSRLIPFLLSYRVCLRDIQKNCNIYLIPEISPFDEFNQDYVFTIESRNSIYKELGLDPNYVYKENSNGENETDEFILPEPIRNELAEKVFKKAIENGYLIKEERKYVWKSVSGKSQRGAQSQFAYLCHRIYVRRKKNESDYLPTDYDFNMVEEFFGVERIMHLALQVYRAERKQKWRKLIDELF